MTPGTRPLSGYQAHTSAPVRGPGRVGEARPAAAHTRIPTYFKALRTSLKAFKKSTTLPL